MLPVAAIAGAGTSSSQSAMAARPNSQAPHEQAPHEQDKRHLKDADQAKWETLRR
jgi:hypothetical protein